MQWNDFSLSFWRGKLREKHSRFRVRSSLWLEKFAFCSPIHATFCSTAPHFQRGSLHRSHVPLLVCVLFWVLWEENYSRGSNINKNWMEASHASAFAPCRAESTRQECQSIIDSIVLGIEKRPQSATMNRTWGWMVVEWITRNSLLSAFLLGIFFLSSVITVWTDVGRGYVEVGSRCIQARLGLYSGGRVSSEAFFCFKFCYFCWVKLSWIAHLILLVQKVPGLRVAPIFQFGFACAYSKTIRVGFKDLVCKRKKKK